MAIRKLLFAFWCGYLAGLLEGAVKIFYHGLSPGYASLLSCLFISGLIYGMVFALMTLLLFKFLPYAWILGAAAAILVLIECACYYLWHHFQLLPAAGGRGTLIFKAAALVAALVAAVMVSLLFGAAGLSERIGRGKILPAWLIITALAMTLVFPLVSAPLVSAGRGAGPGNQYPNLVLVTIDTLRSDSLGCYGSGTASTPVIDSLAGEGVLFSDAVCEMPLTTPSHAAILSSTYPATNKALGNQYLFKKGFLTLPQIFNRRLGYRCAAFISGFPLDSRFGLSRGFHVYDDRFFKHSGVFRNSLLQILARLISGNAIERSAEETTDAALEWIASNGDNRFFLWVHYFDPHAPYEPPSPFDTMYRDALPRRPARSEKERAGILRALGGRGAGAEGMDNLNRPGEQYLGEISYVDHQLGRLFSDLRDAGLWGDTMVILTSDHGESLTEHDYLFQHGEYLYEPSVKVPLIIKRPGRAMDGLRIGTSVQLIDIAPTLLGALQMTSPPTFQGKNLLPLLEGRRDGMDDGPAYIENTDRTPQYRPRKLRAVRTKSWKYVFSPDDGAVEIYSLLDDPGETVNLAGQVDEMQDVLKAWMDRWPEVAEGGRGAEKEILLDEETGRKLRELGYVSE